MSRIYPTKGDAAHRHNFTVPMTANLLEKLRECARTLGLTPTVVARGIIERGIETEMRRKRVE
jgi:hypothetical protein